MTDIWVMKVIHSDGEVKTFTGERDIVSLLLGVKEYLEKQKQNERSSICISDI